MPMYKFGDTVFIVEKKKNETVKNALTYPYILSPYQ